MTDGIIETVKGYYAALVLDALHQIGALDRLRCWHDRTELIDACGVNPTYVAAALDFVLAATNLFETDNAGRVRFVGTAADHMRVAHMLDQYVGGYGPMLSNLAALIKHGRQGDALVNLGRHAAAFAEDDNSRTRVSEAVRIVIELGATSVIELGCGGGQALCDLGDAVPDLTALGIDANPAVVASARELVRKRQLDDRVCILEGEALEVLADVQSAGVQMILASSFLNAFWSTPDDASVFLRRLSALLPGRLLIVSDYYSQLGPRCAQASTRTLIHDLVQVVSGQGLPPPDVDEWARVYAQAGAEMLYVFEAPGDGLNRFVHLIKLADVPIPI